jgi:hypothetical protein
MKKKYTIGRNISINLDMEKLSKLKEELTKKYITRVGVLGQKTNRIPMLTGESHERYQMRVKKIMKSKPEIAENGEKTNAEIGLVHEMGSSSDHIPRRSFLDMPLTLKMPEYAKQFSNQLMKAVDDGNIKPVYINLGIKGEQVVQLAFSSRGFGIWPANRPSTIALKGSSQPLIDTAQLRRSITSDVVNK